MAAREVYIVDFTDDACQFNRAIGSQDLPTIDGDQIKSAVLWMFMQVDPMAYLHRIANDMVQDDYLFSKEDYFESTPWDAQESEKFLRDYLRETILDLGRAMYQKLKSMGMFKTGHERYEVTNRPLTNDTFLFTRIRPLG